MTARGKQVKLQTLSVEREIFVYDRRILSSSNSEGPTASITSPPRSSYAPEKAPDTLSNESNLYSWQKLFKERRSWAKELETQCSKIGDQIRQIEDETVVVQRSAAIAEENVKQHIANLKPRFEETSIWADNVCQDQGFLLEHWESMVGKYPSIPAIRELGLCLHIFPTSPATSISSVASQLEVTLYDLVNIAEITKASNAGKNTSRRFKARAADMMTAFMDVSQKTDSVVDRFDREADDTNTTTAGQAKGSMEEIEVVTRKIDADYEHVLGLPNNPKAVSQASRTALLHTRSFIPTLMQTAKELNQLLKKSIERKNRLIKLSVHHLQEISEIESRIAQVHSSLARLDIEPEEGQVFDLLSAAIRLPSVYGLLLVECVRRAEWTEKITADSSTLVEETATFKEEEIKRRRKWAKEMEGVVDLGPMDDMSFGIDINVRAEKHRWPKVDRRDIDGYMQSLKSFGGFEESMKEIQLALKSLDTPTRQQARRAKAFKSGSVHEVGYGRTSLLLRGDDDLFDALKGEKSKLEDKLKSSESRIRKLEDLLHRQSQVSRPSSSGYPYSIQGASVDRQSSSPVPNYTASLSRPQDAASRRSSVSSRRFSANADGEEKTLTKRIISLEAELNAEKAQSANLQKDAAARVNTEDELKHQVQEAMSTKEDLLGNLEAQQREFDDDRRLLEEENLKLKIRLEEAEDELDQIVGSRDHEGRSHLQMLEEELHRVRDDAIQDAKNAEGEMAALRQELAVAGERNEGLKQHSNEFQIQIEEMTARLQSHQDIQKDHHEFLRSILLSLSPEAALPTDFDSSIRTVETAAKNLNLQLTEVRKLLDGALNQNDAATIQLNDCNGEIQDLKDRLGNGEIEIFSTRETLAETREELARLIEDLDRECKEHDEIKIKFAAGESHVQSLQDQLTEKEREMNAILGAHKDLKAQARDLEKQLGDRDSVFQDLQKIQEESGKRYAQRARKAEDISRKLYSQIGNLERILEQLGYIISLQENGIMAVQKAPKTTGASTVLSSSGPLPAKASESSPPPNFLNWATTEDPDSEAALYAKFSQSISTFDLDAFSAAIIKRVKDAEHLARKWQREARSYREKAHRSQGEAHDKIAFRAFKDGDLALFLPTRNQATRPWAAFNVGAPHYFLREQDSHKLRSRDWLLARISRVEERVVDLSKSITNGFGLRPGSGGDGTSDGASSFDDNENPFELSDGLRWYLLDAYEEKPGAPINVGLGKATVASASVDARGSSIKITKKEGAKDGATKTLTRSLDSRRSSTGSKKGLVPATAAAAATSGRPESSGGGSLNGERSAKEEQPVGNGTEDAAKAAESQKNTDEAKDISSSLPTPVPTPTPIQPSPPTSASASASRPQSTSPRKQTMSPSPASRKKKGGAWDSLWSLDFES